MVVRVKVAVKVAVKVSVSRRKVQRRRKLAEHKDGARARHNSQRLEAAATE